MKLVWRRHLRENAHLPNRGIADWLLQSARWTCNHSNEAVSENVSCRFHDEMNPYISRLSQEMQRSPTRKGLRLNHQSKICSPLSLKAFPHSTSAGTTGANILDAH